MKSFQAQAGSSQTQFNVNVANVNVANGNVANVAAAAVCARAGEGSVLLVEDDETLRRYLEITLRRAGFAVLTAADGIEALKLVHSAEVSAVVTDAVMPRLNGPELCRILRASEAHSSLPLVLLTGIARDEAKPSTCAHADAQLTKPVRPEELTDCLRRLTAERVV